MFKDTLVVALGTAMSRLTGLLRVIVIGVIIGQTALADAFDGANNSPNSIYELLVGGLLAASLVPLFTRFAEDEDEEATQAVVSTSVVVLAIATIVAVACAPFIFRVFSLNPSAKVDVDQFRRAGTAMTRIFLVQIFFYGLSAIGSALLNSRRRFAAAAWSPVLSNIVTITLLILIPFTRDGRPELTDVMNDHTFFWLFTMSATGGIIAMALFLIPALQNTDITFRFTPNFRHPAVRTMVKLSSWTFGYVVTNQIALIIIKNLASPGSGDQDAYSKAFTFFMLPHGLLAISIATTFVPELVRRVRAGDRFGFATWTTSGVRWISILTIPASIAMVILAHPIISALLEHGNFNGAAASNTARALAGFSVGLTGFSLYIFCLRGFYAHEDTRTPFYVNVFENVLNVIFALILVDHYGVFGLGISFGMAYMIASLVLLWLLHTKYQAINWGSLFDMSWRVLGASTIMGAVVWILEKLLDPKSGMSQMAELFICVTAGFVVYVIAIYAFRLKDLQNFSALLPKRTTDVQTTL